MAAYSDFTNRLVAPINPSWLKPLYVESCLVSVLHPELLTQPEKGHYIRPSLQLKYSVINPSSGAENMQTYCAQHPMCVRYR